MNKLTKIILFLVLCACNASAQTKFVDKLTQTVPGEGKVTVHQDQRLTDLINGDVKTADSAADKTNQKVDEDYDTPALVTSTGKKTKVRGYRIQVYWGGSNRIDQAKAQQAASKVATHFPQYKTYTSFESPHWRCRVGDFIDRQEAFDALQEMKKVGIATNGMIVRSEVYIYK